MRKYDTYEGKGESVSVLPTTSTTGPEELGGISFGQE
jgi:hypothetical protein